MTPFVVERLKEQIQSLINSNPEILEDDILRADTFEAETDLHTVLSELVNKVGWLDSLQRAIAERTKELNQRKSRIENQEEHLRLLIQRVLEGANIKSVKLPEATLSMTFRQPRIKVTDADQLPEELCAKKITLIPDMKKIEEAAQKEGMPPRGTIWTNGMNSLTIRKL